MTEASIMPALSVINMCGAEKFRDDLFVYVTNSRSILAWMQLAVASSQIECIHNAKPTIIGYMEIIK